MTLVLAAALALGGCSRSNLPDISDPAQLMADCDHLLQGGDPALVGRDQWPDSIKKLNPVGIFRSGKGVYITTFAQTGAGSRGYVVDHEQPNGPDHYSISGTSYPDIYRFDFQL